MMPRKSAKFAKRIKQELAALFKRHKNRLSPKHVVLYASKHKKSALHQEFNWDVQQAAWQHWMETARRLIRVHVTVLPSKLVNQVVSVREFVSLKSDRYKGGGYRPMHIVMSDKHMMAQLLQDALDDLQIFQRKYSTLQQLAPVFRAIKKVQKALAAVVQQTKQAIQATGTSP
jgi:hypothetical protein